MENSGSKSITLLPLISLDTEAQMKIREIRNEENVRKWMYTDHIIGVNEHLDWINRLKQDDRQLVFAVLDENRNPLGAAGVNRIDRSNKRADWAFFLTDAARGGYGPAVEYSFIDFVFDVLKMEKLNCEVVEGNSAVVKLHKKFLFEEEGFRRADVIKNGNRVGVHLLGLTKQEWHAGRDSLTARYQRIFERTSVAILWNAEDISTPHPIDQIEKARAKNNLNWMSILRLALEKSPNTAKPIIAEIKRLDREISSLTDVLIKDQS